MTILEKQLHELYMRVCKCILHLASLTFCLFSSAFSMNIPNLPIQMVAVTDGGGSAASAFFGTDLGHALITEGNATADRLGAHFTTYTSSGENKCE